MCNCAIKEHITAAIIISVEIFGEFLPKRTIKKIQMKPLLSTQRIQSLFKRAISICIDKFSSTLKENLFNNKGVQNN